MEIKKHIILFTILIHLLSSCYSKEQNSNLINETSNKDLNYFSVEHQKILKIDNRCIWCWKCIHISPKTFKIDKTSLKAKVISQTDIDTDKINSAISICPTKSINYN